MMRAISVTLGLICIGGLVACEGRALAPAEADAVGFRLDRLESGDLQYCSDAGACQRLPYDGDCASLEFEVDRGDASVCQRCIAPDGTTGAWTCSDTAVGCAVVTLPEPDCVVCAYWNGAILFSTCLPDQRPQCYKDSDCIRPAGRPGYCVEEICIYEPACRTDQDCPAGFACALPAPLPKPVTAGGPEAGDPVGICVPRDVVCTSDADCPPDSHCETWCYAPLCDGPGCPPPPPCSGICMPDVTNPCANAKCPAGTHCELTQPQCFTEPCPPVAICVPDDLGCKDDTDCPAGFSCLFERICPAMPCVLGEPCPPCHEYGVCVPDSPAGCTSDGDCPAGFICVAPDPCTPGTSCPPPDNVPGGVCVPVPPACKVDADCNRQDPSGYCIGGVCMYVFDCDPSHALCDMAQPQCPDGLTITVIHGCWGPCVPRTSCLPVAEGCMADTDCPRGYVCTTYCRDCPSNTPGCDPDCRGVCVPQPGECRVDDDCAPGFACVRPCISCDPAAPDCPPSGTACGPGVCTPP